MYKFKDKDILRSLDSREVHTEFHKYLAYTDKLREKRRVEDNLNDGYLDLLRAASKLSTS